MTVVSYFISNGKLNGFEIKGHSAESADDDTGRIVCSAVSSAAYMAVNTLTEIVGAKVKAEVNDGYMSVRFLDKSDECNTIISGLKLHINQLAQQYKNYITVNSEV